MCGIVGYIDLLGQPIAIRKFQEITDLLAHRGPDGSGYQFFPGKPFVALGHRRLSILDLSVAGQQPMSNPDNSLWITFNGEVYNFAEIRSELEKIGYRFRSRTDTEVVLYAYQEWGSDCLKRFNGMFAFAIWDDEKKELFIARDRLGIKPLYYIQRDSVFLFSSEIKSILQIFPARPDWEALHSPFRHQITPQTGFKDIKKLPAGHYVTIAGNHAQMGCYWDIDPVEESLSESDAIDELIYLLDDATKLQMIADVPVGAFLSGGLDSSAIVAMMKRHTEHPIHTYTIAFSESDQAIEAMSDDSHYAQKVANSFGCEHHSITVNPDITELLPKMIWHLDEPLADPAVLNSFLIAQMARNDGIIVLLNGMGGDELFGGYRKQLACLIAQYYQTLLPSSMRSVCEKLVRNLPVASQHKGFRLMRWMKRFFSFASRTPAERFMLADLTLSAEQYKRLYVRAEDFPYEGLPSTQSYLAHLSGDLSYTTSMCLTDTKVFLPDHNLTYLDKATMAASIESRPPLIDHRLVDFMFRRKPDLRIKGKTQKYLLKKAMEGFLPNEIIYRPKAPFGVPLRSWISGALAEMIDDYLAPSVIRQRGLWRQEEVWKIIREDRSGQEDHSHRIWQFLTTELWFRIFIDQSVKI
jgi:asparagine synthase (glutamine-hydrolysing)